MAVITQQREPASREARESGELVRHQMPWLPGMLASIAIALHVAAGELSRLSGQVLTADGHSWPAAVLVGPGRILGLFGAGGHPLAAGWNADYGEAAPARQGWVLGYLCLELIVIALWGLLAWSVVVRVIVPRFTRLNLGTQVRISLRLFRRSTRIDLRSAWDFFQQNPVGPCAAAAVLMVAVLRAAALLAALVVITLPGASHDRMAAASVLSGLAWIGALLVAVTFLLGAVVTWGQRRHLSVWRVIGDWTHAFYRQRFSLFVIVPIAVLGLPAGSDLLDQIPDIQRNWLDDPRGMRHFLAAVAATALVAGVTFVVGRLRSTALWLRTETSVQREPRADLRLGWAFALGMPLLAAVVAGFRGSAPLDGVLLTRALLFFGLPLVLVGVSQLIRIAMADAGGQPGKRGPGAGSLLQPARHAVPTPAQKRAIVLAGDLISAASMVIGGLTLVRSMTSVVALGAVGGTAAPRSAVLLLIGGVLVAGGCWLCWPLARRLTATRPRAGDRVTAVGSPGRAGASGAGGRRQASVLVLLDPTHRMAVPESWRRAVLAAVLAGGALLFGAIGLLPAEFADTCGVIATALLALLAIALMVSGVVLLVQERLAPEIFWFKPIRMPSLPVAGLLVMTLLMGSTLGSDLPVHGLRPGPENSGLDALARPSMRTVVENWVKAPGTEHCGQLVQVGDGQVRLRAMPIVAAEGGGARAAYWTAATLDLLAGRGKVVDQRLDWTSDGRENPCARALFSGGASGGSVGLTVSQVAGRAARDQVLRITGPQGLGMAISGLFVRDVTYAATGVPWFGVPDGRGRNQWRDRAALIENSWESNSNLDQPFLPARATSLAGSLPGALVLNSTRVADGCRVWVSQISVAPAGVGCDSTGAPAGHTLDLFAALTPTETDDQDRRSLIATGQCLGNPSAATAALLSSRFPYVTPSGVLGPCAREPEQQLVDGGYVENTGLGTVVDLAPQWLKEVQRRNDEALAELASGGTPEVIVPVVVYLDNGTGTDLVAGQPPLTTELLVPGITYLRATGALVGAPALLRAAAATASSNLLFSDTAPTAGDLTAAIDAWRGPPVMVVHQSTFPAVTAPLGWTLSKASIETMDRGLAAQASGEEAGAVAAVRENGSLHDLLRLVGTTSH